MDCTSRFANTISLFILTAFAGIMLGREIATKDYRASLEIARQQVLKCNEVLSHGSIYEKVK